MMIMLILLSVGLNALAQVFLRHGQDYPKVNEGICGGRQASPYLHRAALAMNKTPWQ